MPSLIFDDVPSATCRVFTAPVDAVCANGADEIAVALAQLQAHLDAGRYLAGYFSYELGYTLERRLAARLPSDRAVPLLWFGVFDHAARSVASAEIERTWRRQRAFAGPLQLEWDEATYGRKFARVAAHIAEGDIYQANLSMRGRFPVVGDPRGLYCALRQCGGARYSAYVDDGNRCILSFSPELFFSLDATGCITCRPMKGTAPRVAEDPVADAAAIAGLQASAKNRAENLMIVDLVRNDLGRVADTGSVQVTDLFQVERYPTVYQMVSTISAKRKQGTSVQRLLEALFPCGSVTGAPKIRAMEVISDLEASPRGVYCGAIGWFAPNGSASFNVAIRTLTVQGGCGELGIGGGLVADSTSCDEYAECCVKARYFTAARRPLKLIETLRFEAGAYVRLELHLQRLERTAAVFHFPFNRSAALDVLDSVTHDAAPPLRVRLTLNEHGQLEVQSSPYRPVAAWHYMVSPKTVNSQDALLRYKTDWRDLYESQRASAQRTHGCDEIVFCNERGELCEGSRSNLFLAIGGELLTPAQASGLLPGCLRRELLDAGLCREAVLKPADLAAADQVYFGNSLRGLVPAILTTTKPREAPAAAGRLNSNA